MKKKKIIINIIIGIAMFVVNYFGFGFSLYDVVLPKGLNTILLKIFVVYIDAGCGIQMLLYYIPKCEKMKLIANKYKEMTFYLIGLSPAILASIINIFANYLICIGYIKTYGENGKAQKSIALCMAIVIISVIILIIFYRGHNRISSEDFLRVRTQIQHQVKRAQKSIKYNAGGHGRKKKLRPLEKYRKKEKNFREHYNHRLSKEIVNFAVKNHAKYINMENLSGYDASRFLERNWSYFDLQQKIIYKANQYGIIVRKVNPCYSSQVCSVCGNWHPENRPKGEKGQAYFYCHNENCKSHEFRNYNADYNASRNIAMADGVMIMNVFDGSKNENQKAKKITDEHRKIAREYYGFDDFYQEFKEQEKAKEKAKKEKSA